MEAAGPMFRKFTPILLACLALAPFTGPVLAQEAGGETNVDAKRDWSIFRASEDPKECWIVTIPASWEATLNGKKTEASRGESMLMVTNRPGSNVNGEISYKSGFPIREGSTVNLRIGDASFEFYAEGEWAWPANAEEDIKVIAALQRGATAVATSTSEKGKVITDSFSLLGFSAAYDTAVSMCKE
jgi:hypothetical protein